MDKLKKIDRLIELQVQKKEIMNDFFELSKMQSQHFNEDEVEELQELIVQKQKHIESIDSIDDEFEQLFTSIKAEFGVESLEQAREIPVQKLGKLKSVTAEIMSLLEMIQQCDRSNTQKAKELKNFLADEIGKLSKAKKVNIAYTYGNSLPQSHYIDSKQ